MKLVERIKQGQDIELDEQSMLNIMVTSSWILSELTATMALFGITPSQYNVLRILRGSRPLRLTCGDIKSRLIDRTPDVTRLVTRLMKRGLVDRARADRDRRVVEVWITDAGLEVLGNADPAVDAKRKLLMKSLDDDKHLLLNELMDKLRDTSESEYSADGK